MAIAFNAIGARSGGGTTTVSIDRPASGAAGMLAIAGRVGFLTPVTWSNESGWTAGPSLDGGVNVGGTPANDSHTTAARADYQELAGGEGTPVVFDQTLSGTGGTDPGCVGMAINYTKADGMVWDVVGTAGDDASHGSHRAITANGSLSFQPGDVLVCIVAYDTDAFAGSPTYALSASGITFGGTTKRSPDGAGITTGRDGNIQIAEATVSSGSGTVAPALAITQVTNQCGPAVFLRLREVAPTLVVSATAQGQITDSPTLTQTHELAAIAATQGQRTSDAQPAPVAISHIGRASTIGAVTTATPHLMFQGDTLVINADPPDDGYNGTYTAVPFGDSIIFFVSPGADDPSHPATGSIQRTSDVLALTQVHNLVVADLAQGQITDSPALTQTHELTVAELAQGQTLESPALTQTHELTVAELGQGQITDSPALTQTHELTVAELAQGQITDSPTLTVLGGFDLPPLVATGRHDRTLTATGSHPQ